jgi:hypothetical protein
MLTGRWVREVFPSNSVNRWGVALIPSTSGKKTYIIDSLPGEFTALELVSIMYAAFQQFAPESDIGIDLSVEYRAATRG